MCLDNHSNNEPGYRDNVGVMIINDQNRILAGEAFYYPGEWLMPQGGIGSTESEIDAMERELQEETGLTLKEVVIKAEASDWLYYLFNKPQYKDDIFYKGQRQKWFLVSFNGDAPLPPNVEIQEFSQFDWVTPDWLIENTASFLKPIYQQVVKEFSAHFS